MEDIKITPKQNLTPDFKRQLQTILDTEMYPTKNNTPALQEKFVKRYSFGALVASVFYYAAMRDKLFIWLSILCSVVFLLSPLLLIMPIWARRRAYVSRSWQSYGEFEHVQRQWDRAGICALALVILLIYLMFRILTPVLLNGFKQINPNLYPSSGNYLEQLQQTEDDLRQTLGQ